MGRIEELVNLIKDYSETYYTGVAKVSDEEFDSLVDELRTIDPENEILKTPGWGYNPGKKTNHLYGLKIGSLGKVKRVEDIDNRFKNNTTRVSAKLDGLSVVCYYKDGTRIKAVTRGNGVEGIDVTSKMRVISPKTEHLTKNFTGAVRGEVLIDNQTWENIKNDPDLQGYANQRNLAAGILNRKNIDDDLELLRYVTYKILNDSSRLVGGDPAPNFMVDFGSIQELRELGFTVVPLTYIETLHEDWSEENLRSKYDEFCKTYPCDGLVLTAVSLTFDNGNIGYDEIAYKFQAESKIVEVTDVTYNLTRTGRLVPLIWFDPVELSGAMVKKCSGFNAQFIRDHKINKGTVIEVQRSNEVIPYCMRVVEPSDEGLVPSEYYDGTPVEWEGTDLRIPNYEEGTVYHFISTVAPVDGAGWSIYSSLIDLFNLNLPSDLVEFYRNWKDYYYLSVGHQYGGEATKKKMYEILDKLDSPIDPVTFLVACNVGGLGWTNAEKIVAQFPDILQTIKDRRFYSDIIGDVKGIGYSMVESFEKNLPKIQSLLDVVKIKETSYINEKKEETKFKVAITGALSMKRADFDKLLNEHGIEQGKVKDCKYLITNTPDSGSSKNADARKYGVEIISEEEFVKKYFV